MNNIGGINGYGYGYGVNGYGNNGKNNANNTENEGNNGNAVQPEAKPQVNADEVMKFLEKNNFFIAPAGTQGAEGVSEVDAETQDRIAGYMEQFEVIYAVVVEEFGEELAPAVMDLVMDKLMGLVD